MTNIFKMTTLAAAAVALAMSAGLTAQADTLKVGAAVSLTGKYSTNGEHTRNGYNLAVKHINEAGGVKVGDQMLMLEVVYYDDESTPARGAQLAERLISQDGINFLLGPYSSGLTKAIAPVTEKHGVPMVEGNGASRSLFTQGYEYLFAVLSTSEQYLSSAIDLAAERARADGRDPSDLKVAMAFENDPFSQDVRAGVVDDVHRHGMKIVIDDKLPPELNDMSTTLTKVKAVKPDILVVSGHAKGAATAIRQVAEQRVDVPMLAITHCDSAQVIKKFGDAAEFTLCASQWASSVPARLTDGPSATHWRRPIFRPSTATSRSTRPATLSYEDELFGTAADYAATFEAEYGYVPPYQSAESTAAVQTLVAAIERAGTLDRRAVRDALAQTDIQTFYGNVKIDETGKNIGKPMVLFQVQDGEYKVVAPTRWAASELIHPRPNWKDRLTN